MPYEFDEKNQEIVKNRQANRDQNTQPRVGDYVRFATGEVERFSHNWGDGLQTSPSGSFYLTDAGGASFSGGLNPATQADQLVATDIALPGDFWIFHHGFAGAGRAVYFQIPCRLYLTDAPYTGFLGSDWQGEAIRNIRNQLDKRFGPAAREQVKVS